jgi:hypothetical protein
LDLAYLSGSSKWFKDFLPVEDPSASSRCLRGPLWPQGLPQVSKGDRGIKEKQEVFLRKVIRKKLIRKEENRARK